MTMKTAMKSTAKPARNPNRETAVQVFTHNIASARELLTMIRRHLDDHMGVAPDEVHWGHVGDAAHTVEQLKEIAISCNLIPEE